ncbi:hypothetical protein EV200_109147 [Pedobacter psychrotolerans]|uniref:Uncharacterized protein n=1 Tax=Pedobacter psychrotolerans TaxID=1843235 RepID=A0A4R2H481_9SPHI|nr:hypothetical protein [Pedobacter psychrotolerans]TCO19963.1 hypothetical protein EV200_109147 [Pedobacter psychrotolerans]GGE50115.1 hypothetical protein GCM10011413_15440 [Pedobacter psychrotolerans]
MHQLETVSGAIFKASARSLFVFPFSVNNQDEITDPISVLHDFFISSRLPGHLRLLKQWRNDAAFASEAHKNGDASSLLYHYELIIKLIEAAWLLKGKKFGQIKINSEDEIDIAKWHIKLERKNLEDYPGNLSIREIIRPASVIKKIFRIHKPEGYRKILNIWLHDALSNSFMEEGLTKTEVIIVYEQLVKLFEAMWLISQRIIARA